MLDVFIWFTSFGVDEAGQVEVKAALQRARHAILMIVVLDAELVAADRVGLVHLEVAVLRRLLIIQMTMMIVGKVARAARPSHVRVLSVVAGVVVVVVDVEQVGIGVAAVERVVIVVGRWLCFAAARVKGRVAVAGRAVSKVRKVGVKSDQHKQQSTTQT